GMVCTATFRSVNSWGGGYQGEVTVTNTGTLPLNGWMAHISLPSGQSIGSLWNGTYTQSGSDITVTNAGWNGALGVGQSTTFGFTVNTTGAATGLDPHCMTT
ncbi:chitin-binding protein, partial [Actinomadura sp. GC306]|uniref:cellulose binding domain-containing protein n=1 Tax=Actinomadura sp. GC306 TaxID=2530367 RepID=UPI0010F0F273